MSHKAEKLILNRHFSLPEDGKFQIMPYGEFDGHLTDGTPIIQVLDQQAALNIEASMRRKREAAGDNWPGLLVDLEHRSLLPDGDTTAAAWVPDLEVRPQGMFAAMNFTALGEPLVKGGQYRTLSPVFALEKVGQAPDGRPRMRPVALDSIGLTNKPNLKGMKPITFCANGWEWFILKNKAVEAQQKGNAMKEVLKALGLAEDADEAAVLAAVKALQEQAAANQQKDQELQTAQNRVRELEAAEIAREADVFVAANAAKFEKPGEIKELYIANKEATIKLVAAMKAPAPAKADPPPVAANRSMKTPDEHAEATLASNRETEVKRIMSENRSLTHSQAWAMAASQKPELFKN